MERVLKGKPVVPGHARGQALVTSQALSLWGGLDPATGTIIDRHHELAGTCVAGRVFVLPRGRGSCTSSAVLLDCIARGTAPVAIINADLDPILALGSIVADEHLHQVTPIVLLAAAELAAIGNDDWVRIEEDGTVHVE